MRPRSWIAGTLLLAVISVGAAALLVPEARWRLIVIGRFAAGQIEQMSFAELRRLLTPGSGFYPTRLADSPNPFSGILNRLTTPGDLTAGAAVFATRCANCHGAGGAGGTGIRLVDAVPKRGSSDWALYRTIRYGLPGTPMPAHPDLEWKTTWQLVGYVGDLLRGGARVDAGGASKPSVAPVRFGDIAATGGAADSWLTYSGSLDGIRFSRLDEINTATVGGLRLAWIATFPHREPRAEATPLAWGGLLFLTVPPGRVVALEAGTGQKRWQWTRDLPDDLRLCCSTSNRGVAVLGNRVFVGTLDAHLIALDSSTGKELWDVQVADYRKGYSITGAPLVVRDMVVTGVAGGEFGIRGFLDAYDARTGQRRWRTYTVPAAGEPAAKTWAESALATGGAPTWMTGAYDADLDTIYWGVGNPAPGYNADKRPGDNLYSNSVLALTAGDGARRWHFQFTPNDEHDWDATHVPLLVDLPLIPGHPKLLLNPNRNAFYYVLDRISGQFITGTPFAKQSWASGLSATGRPIELPNSRPSRTGTLAYPSAAGATNWWPSSFSPQTGLVYIPAVQDRGSVFFKSDETLERVEGESWVGSNSMPAVAEKHRTAVKAVRADTGEIVWEVFSEPRAEAAEAGGLLSTAGGLVFGSDVERFFALDARTGNQLWSVNLGVHVVAAPMSFSHEGKQYVAIVAGQNLLAFRLP